MSNRNNISEGVDWMIVWLYAILVAIGILCIFMVEYRTDTNWMKTFLGRQNQLQQATDLCRALHTYCHFYFINGQ
jgi:rod shape determining protein RodA